MEEEEEEIQDLWFMPNIINILKYFNFVYENASRFGKNSQINKTLIGVGELGQQIDRNPI